MVIKLNVYTLTNFFSKKNTLFIPKSDSEVHEQIIDKLSKQKISRGELKTLEDIYNGISIIPNLDNFSVERINIHLYSAKELNNLIYNLFGLRPELQLIFYTTDKTIDYEARLVNDSKSKPKKIQEVFGFYHKNKYGKRLLNCNLNKNDIISGSTDSSDLTYTDNSIIYSKKIEENHLYYADYDNYESKHGSKDNFTELKKLMYPFLKQTSQLNTDLETENKKLLDNIVKENNTLQNMLDSTKINNHYFNKDANNRINNFVMYSSGYEKNNLNLKDIFDGFDCSIDYPFVRYRNFIKNNLFKVYKYGLDISLFDRDSLQKRKKEIEKQIELFEGEKKTFYQNQKEEIEKAIDSLKGERKHNDYKKYLNEFDVNTSVRIDEKTFSEWKTNQILPKEFYVRDNYEDKTESLIFKIRYETDYKMIYISFVLFNDGHFEIKNISDKDFLEINDIHHIILKVNKVIEDINKKNGIKINPINGSTNVSIKNLNCTYTITIDDNQNLKLNDIKNMVTKFYQNVYMFKIDGEYSKKTCGLKESISVKFKKIGNFNSENNIIKYFKILKESSGSMDIEEFKKKVWIPEAKLKFNMTEIEALQMLESIV